MPKINEAERRIQNHIIDFFKSPTTLGYQFYGNLSEDINTNIMEDKLKSWLINRGESPTLAEKAINELVKTAGNLQQGLYKANQEVYSMLKYGAKVHEEPGESDKTVYLIDWENPQNNEFGIAEEVTIKTAAKRRPDIVIYINGIAIAIIELKKSTVSV